MSSFEERYLSFKFHPVSSATGKLLATCIHRERERERERERDLYTVSIVYCIFTIDLYIYTYNTHKWSFDFSSQKNSLSLLATPLHPFTQQTQQPENPQDPADPTAVPLPDASRPQNGITSLNTN